MTKIPEPAPTLEHYYDKLAGENDSMAVIRAMQQISSGKVPPTDDKGRYLYWDKIKHMNPPEGFTREALWFAIKASRTAQKRELPFVDVNGEPFWFCIPDPALEDLLHISTEASGSLAGDPQLADEKLRTTHLVRSLIEESIYSSKIEGAATTRAAARDMLRNERKPKNNHERMIVNNYSAMRFIREHKDEKLTPALIFALHEILMEGTGLADHLVGALRPADEPIVISDMDEKILHRPPPSDQLAARLKLLCKFANDGTRKIYVPPVFRAIIVHFIMGYDHPFVDGNGRTARALFYWVMAREGFWLMEHISISTAIKKATDSYLKAYLYTEHDGNDVTYFLMHQLGVIKKGITGLKSYLQSTADEMIETERALAGSGLSGKLNHRQLALVKHALLNPGKQYSVKGHQGSHGITQQTARVDLMKLAEEYQLLTRHRVGKADIFVAPVDLHKRVRGN